ncbi:MAG: efflux RND transporter periplasmic adaptor subunit [Rhodomicrobium sp.]
MNFQCDPMFWPWRCLLILFFLAVASGTSAQAPSAGPPAVGVVRAEEKPLTETSRFIGRIQAVGRVNLVARVTGFLEKRFFNEGAEVKEGDLLYRIEQPPFKADVQAKQSVVDQLKAQLDFAKQTLERAKSLLAGPAGQQSTYDSAVASERSLQAQVLGAEAQLQQSQINLSYTEIRAPIAGKIGQTAITEGNVVGPTSGTLSTIVSQDPMYVIFPVAVRTVNELRQRFVPRGGFRAVRIKIQLPDGRIYGEEGELNFVDNTVAPQTETVNIRGSIANPLLPISSAINRPLRELFDGQFVNVILEGVQAVMAISIPRAAVLSDQQGDYVYVVGPDDKAEIRRIELGQSTPATAFILKGLQQGERVVLEGLQRVKPGQPVSPSPASPQPSGGTGNP